MRACAHAGRQSRAHLARRHAFWLLIRLRADSSGAPGPLQRQNHLLLALLLQVLHELAT